MLLRFILISCLTFLPPFPTSYPSFHPFLLSFLSSLPSSVPFLPPSIISSFLPFLPFFLPSLHSLSSTNLLLTPFFFLHVSSPLLNSLVKRLETLPLCEPQHQLQLQPTRYTSCNLLPQHRSILFTSLHFTCFPSLSFFSFITSRTYAHSSYLARMHNYCSVVVSIIIIIYYLLFFTS